MIINSFYYDSSGKVKLVLYTARQALRKIDHPCYYVMTTFPEDIKHVMKNIPKEILEKINSREIKLLLDGTWEPLHSIVDEIYKELDVENVILLTSMFDLVEYITDVSLSYNKPKLECYYFSVHELYVHFQVEKYKKEYFCRLQHKVYEKKYLSLNFTWRLHRPILVASLHTLGLLEYGHVSLPHTNNEYQNHFQHMVDFLDDSFEHYQVLLDNKDSICSIPNLVLDGTDDLNKINLYPKLDKYYDETYFSIVTETIFFSPREELYWFASSGLLFVTEKIFKPIAEKHPFVLVGKPKSLAFLRSLGYKTFYPYIDESYDMELNDSKRLSMIIKETKRLCNLSGSELSEYIDYCHNICEHNFNVLASKSLNTDFLIPLHTKIL